MNENEYKLDYFDPYKFDYKSYIKEIHGLNEMPSVMQKREYYYDDEIINHMDGVRIEKSADFIENFGVGSQTYRLYREEESNSISFYLLYKDQPFICMEYSYSPINVPIVGIKNNFIYNHIKYKGLLKYFFDNYIIPREKVIVSDNTLSERGFKFWQYIFVDYVEIKKTHKMYVMDYNTGDNIIDVKNKSEMMSFYKNELYNYRFVLEKL